MLISDLKSDGISVLSFLVENGITSDMKNKWFWEKKQGYILICG